MEVKVGKLSTTDFECGLLKIKKFMSVPTWIENSYWKLHDSSKSLFPLKMNFIKILVEYKIDEVLSEILKNSNPNLVMFFLCLLISFL